MTKRDLLVKVKALDVNLSATSEQALRANIAAAFKPLSDPTKFATKHLIRLKLLPLCYLCEFLRQNKNPPLLF